MPLPPAPDLDPHVQNVQHGIDVCTRALELFGPEGLAFSFNGGKDSTAVLHVLLAAVKQWRESNNQRWTPADGLAGVHVFYFESASDFPEVEEFVHASDKEHSLSLATYACPFKEGIERMLAERAIKGIFIGTRHGDPNCEGQEFFCPSSRGWPPFMRINPVLNWTYSDVWRYLRDASASYCCLYDKGYTSLGSVRDTKPNSALLRPDGTYAPAHELSDSKLERSGRHSLAHGGRQQSRVAELAHTAAIAIIGDEILCGKVTDQNSPFLVTQLHRLGWKVHKVVVLPDNVDVIGRELRSVMASCQIVITCGGVGPTVDDCTIEAVGMAVGSHIAPHADLVDSIRAYFGSKVTDSHLKMANVPEGHSELLPDYDATGKPSPFPLLKVQNAFVLPGPPGLVRSKWQAIRSYLRDNFDAGSTTFHNRVMRLRLSDEAKIASVFAAVVNEFPDVAAGSYPGVSEDTEGTVSISLEAKDEEQVVASMQRLQSLLDADADPHLSRACIERVTVDVESFGASSAEGNGV